MFQDFRAFNPLIGYRLMYRLRETNHCPGCGQTHWIVGRSTAECAFCATALPIQDGAASGSGVFRQTTSTRLAAAA